MTNEELIKKIIDILNLNAERLKDVEGDRETINICFDTFIKLADVLINRPFGIKDYFMNENLKNHIYIGDAVYAEFVGHGVWLRTQSHEEFECTNKVYLDFDCLQRLNDFCQKKLNDGLEV